MRALNFVLIPLLPKMPTYFFTDCPTYHYDLCDVPLVVRVPQFEKLGFKILHFFQFALLLAIRMKIICLNAVFPHISLHSLGD